MGADGVPLRIHGPSVRRCRDNRWQGPELRVAAIQAPISIGVSVNAVIEPAEGAGLLAVDAADGG